MQEKEAGREGAEAALRAPKHGKPPRKKRPARLPPETRRRTRREKTLRCFTPKGLYPVTVSFAAADVTLPEAFFTTHR